MILTVLCSQTQYKNGDYIPQPIFLHVTRGDTNLTLLGEGSLESEISVISQIHLHTKILR
jgi:hypothetical protein